MTKPDKALIKEYQEVYDWFMSAVGVHEESKKVAISVIKLYEDNRQLEAEVSRLSKLINKGKSAKA